MTMISNLASSFTTEQREALALDRHCIVSAAAGSGKTRVLVERYVRILLEGIDPRYIVAITFTRKAASEMLFRVAQRVDQLLAESNTPFECVQRLGAIRDKLSMARITTIHSFCTHILREFPVEAGVSPDFTEIGSGELEKIRNTCTVRVLEQWLQHEVNSMPTRQLLFALGQKTVEECLNTLSLDREQLIEMSRFYTLHSDNDLKALRSTFLREQCAPVLKKLVSVLKEVFSKLDDNALSAKVSERVATARATYSALEPVVHQLDETTDHDIFSALIVDMFGLLKNICTEKGTMYVDISKKVTDFDSQINVVLAEAFKTLGKIALAVADRVVDDNQLRYARLLQNMAEDVMVEIQKEKNNLSALDFDDMQIVTRDLLENEEVCRQIRRSIPYLMIDEFQDTNSLQYSIAKKIASALQPELDTETMFRSPNIFIVGDAKQSIYGFRKADVRVFEEARYDIRAANQRSISLHHSIAEPSRGDIQLSASFRMAPPLVAFVNEICSHIMPPQSQGYDVGYEWMVSARSANSLTPSHIELCVGQSISGSNPSAMDIPLTEAQLIALRIDSIIRGDNAWQVWDEDLRSLRGAHFGDIAVLARAATKFEALIHEFRLRDIPFLRHSGRGFYQTQEVVDIISLLRFLNNNDDDIALTALLRSPFFALNDAQLYRIAVQSTSKTMWQRLRSFVSEKKNDAAKQLDMNMKDIVTRAYQLIMELQSETRYSSVTQLIRFALSRTAWYGSAAFSDRVIQVKANVEKLIDGIRDIEQRGFRSIHDIVEEVERLQDSTLNESEAAVITGENAVNIMTIHAAKGLEFPIVVLYSTNAQPHQPKSFLSNENIGHSFKVPGESGKSVYSVYHLMSTQIEAQKSAAEEKRMLYVALTRARDHLIVSSETSMSGVSKGLAVPKAAQGLHALVLSAIKQPLRYDSHQRIHIESKLQHLRDGVVQPAETISFNVDVVVDQASPASQKGGPLNSAANERPLLLDTISADTQSDTVSASQLMTFQRDPLEYFRVYQLGLPATNDREYRNRKLAADEDNDGLTGSMAGTIIHSILSRINEWLDDDCHVVADVLSFIVKETLHSFNITSAAEIAQRLDRDISVICSSSLLQTYRPFLKNARFEYSLHIPLRRDILSGTIDVIIESPSGEFEVWDWKTNRLDERSTEFWFQHYQLQLRVYCYLLAHLYPKQQRFCARLVFTRSAEMRELVLDREQALDLGFDLQTRIEAMRLPSQAL